jgi:hypothetical protein
MYRYFQGRRMVKMHCRIRPMTASGDFWQSSHALGVAVIGYDYWGLNLVRNFTDLDNARVVFERRPRGRHPGKSRPAPS